MTPPRLWPAALALLAGTALAGPRPPHDEVYLRRLGARPDAASLRALLDRLVPSEREHEIARLLADMLGAADPAGRNTAQRRLIRTPTAAAAALREAVRSPDPEVRRRARLVYDRVVREIPEATIEAVLRTIARREVRGLAPDVLRTVSASFDPYGVHLAERAMFKTARKDDAPRLRRALADPDAAIRVVALAGLAALEADPDAIGLPRLLAHPDERVRAAAAEYALRAGSRDALPSLVALLDARHPRPRARAVRLLRHLSGRAFGYDPFAPPGPRRAAAEAWKKWADTEGRTAMLSGPVPFRPPPRGRRLLARMTHNAVDETDLGSNRTAWRLGGPDFEDEPWIVAGQPDGGRLVALYSRQEVKLFDRHGRVVRSWRGLPASPTSARLLDGGDLLATCGFMTGKGVIVRLSPEDSIVWKLEHEGQPMDAQPLDDGNLLVSLYGEGRVVEMTRAGEIVRSLGAGRLRGPYSAHRLPNGHTLIADMGGGRVVELDGDDEIVRETDAGYEWLYCVQPLENGTVLFAAQKGVYRLGLDGETKLLRKTKKSYNWVHRN